MSSTRHPFPDGIDFGQSRVTTAKLDIQSGFDRIVERIERLGLPVPRDVRDAAVAVVRNAHPTQQLTFVADGSCEKLQQSKITAKRWKLLGLHKFSIATATVELETEIVQLSRSRALCWDLSLHEEYQRRLDAWTEIHNRYYRRLTFGELEDGETLPTPPSAPTGELREGVKRIFLFALVWYANLELSIGAASTVVRIAIQNDSISVSTQCCFDN